jgi:two-component system sensor histidine kinase CiaH
VGDGVAVDPRDDGAEREALQGEHRLVRRTRWRLVLWSGVSTLVVLLVLGAALYAAVENRLVTSSVDQLRATVNPVVNALTGTDADHGAGTDAPGSAFGLQPGRGSIWLYAFDKTGQQVPLNRRMGVPLAGMPVPESLAAARTAPDGTDVREVALSIGNTVMPTRLLTQRFVYVQDGQTYFLQAIQDRTVEVQTLQTLLTVLLVGGAIVAVVSVLFGYLYASRALVPIRQSLEGQREALRRQREFAADASHELRTPLTVIRSSVEHLNRHRDRPVEQQREALDDIEAEVQHLTTLVDDLLLLARSDSGAVAIDRIPLDLGDTAFEAAGALGRTAADRGVHVEVDPEPAMLEGDPARLRQLVTILVDNAVRHSPRDGRVTVVVRSAGGVASVEVDDQGPGVREEDMPHVFDRFWRAPGAPSGGTGLGLAIAKWIVDRHGGRIGVANRPGGGAAFRVELPVARPGLPPDQGRGGGEMPPASSALLG